MPEMKKGAETSFKHNHAFQNKSYTPTLAFSPVIELRSIFIAPYYVTASYNFKNEF